MTRLNNLAANIEDWGGVKSPSFKSFARKFKNDFKKELTKVGADITSFNAGHYYVSGFFRTSEGQCWYFYIPDVRYSGFGEMLYRTVKNENDYAGGTNQYCVIESGMVHKMKLS